MDRAVTPEFIDDPRVSPADLDYAMSYLRGVNRRLGGVEALLSHLRRWSADWPRGRAVTLLDIATGSGDLPLEARRWAESAGFDLRVTAVDVSERMLEMARRHIGGQAGIELVCADARSLLSRFGAGSFDYVHAGLFLHHLDEGEVVSMLRVMAALAGRGLVWNDLIRTRRGYAVTWLFTLGRPRVLRHDALASIRAGFTSREAMDLAERAGLRGATYSGELRTHRFTLTLDKQARTDHRAGAGARAAALAG